MLAKLSTTDATVHGFRPFSSSRCYNGASWGPASRTGCGSKGRTTVIIEARRVEDRIAFQATIKIRFEKGDKYVALLATRQIH
ncbi:hypothetical protein IMZ48_40740 [Candidatus Bathyarchaeota archaeon]|nr:hypothetical protein [Candidatus Bathyarchaeota archaeon]